MSNSIEVINLHKSFKPHFYSKSSHVLKGLNFKIPQGSVTGFLGANGSGKTTTFKCLLNLIKKDEGDILFFGQPLSLETRSKIGFLPEHQSFYEDLTAREYLLFLSQLSTPFDGKKLSQQIDVFLEKLNLIKYKDEPLKIFSKGMKQKIKFIQSLLPQPEVLILDEPFSGLDLDGRFQMMELIEEMKNQGTTIFLSSHILQDIERICNRLLILKSGSVIFEGNYSDLPTQSESKYSIVYLQNNKKQSLKVESQEACQNQIQKLITEGATILSVSSESSNLERIYKQLAFENKGEA